LALLYFSPMVDSFVLLLLHGHPQLLFADFLQVPLDAVDLVLGERIRGFLVDDGGRRQLSRHGIRLRTRVGGVEAGLEHRFHAQDLCFLLPCGWWGVGLFENRIPLMSLTRWISSAALHQLSSISSA
jgi:hypothetical protein